jgi:adenosylmethionine-8-amino-7-oxononanoate aminotransferase
VGFGRTGTLFAMEQVGIVPDLLCLAKGLTGGYLPLAATLATEAIYNAFRGDYTAYRTLFHGHTFTGNPLACAAALGSLELFEEEQVISALGPKIAALTEVLKLKHPWIQERRQKGLMAAILLAKPDGTPFDPSERVALKICYAAREEGVILRNLGDAVILMPPLSMTPQEILSIKTMLHQAFLKISKISEKTG